MSRVFAFVLFLAAALATALILLGEGSPPPRAPLPTTGDHSTQTKASGQPLPHAQAETKDSVAANAAARQELENPQHDEDSNGPVLALTVLSPDGSPANDALLYFDATIATELTSAEIDDLRALSMRAHIGEISGAQMLRQYGESRRSDSAGRVDIPIDAHTEEFFRMSMWIEHASGQAIHEYWENSVPATIQLVAHQEVDCRVLHADGSPAPWVAVTLQEIGIDDRRHDYGRIILGATGSAKLSLNELDLQSDHESRNTFLNIGAPLNPQQLDRLALSTEEINNGKAVLQLPPTAAVEIILPEGTKNGSAVFLGWSDDVQGAYDSFGEDRRLSKNGRVVFPYTGVGLNLKATLLEGADSSDPELEFEGPRAAGEHLVVDWAELASPTKPWLIRGHFVSRYEDSDLKLFSRVRVRLKNASGGMALDSGVVVESNADGEFELSLHDAPENGALELLFLMPKADGEDPVLIPRSHSFPSRTDEFDLGAISIDESPPWVAGKVVSDQGKPINGARVAGGSASEHLRDDGQIELHVPRGPDSIVYRSGSFGDFELTTPRADSLLRPAIEVAADGYFSKKMEVTLGDQELEVVLQRAAQLEIAFDLRGQLSQTNRFRPSVRLFDQDDNPVGWQKSENKNSVLVGNLHFGETYRLVVKDSSGEKLCADEWLTMKPEVEETQVHRVALEGDFHLFQVQLRNGENILSSSEYNLYRGDQSASLHTGRSSAVEFQADGSSTRQELASEGNISSFYSTSAEMDVVAILSADGRYVRASIQPGLTVLEPQQALQLTLPAPKFSGAADQFTVEYQIRPHQSHAWRPAPAQSADESGNLTFKVPGPGIYQLDAWFTVQSGLTIQTRMESVAIVHVELLEGQVQYSIEIEAKHVQDRLQYSLDEREAMLDR